jgi:drug/metabolite transporter (DMT)-like permease
VTSQAAALRAPTGAADARRLRLAAIAWMIAAVTCFTVVDASAKWLGGSLPAGQVIWARYFGAAVLALAVVNPLSRPSVLVSRRPGLQILRSLLLLGSTAANFVAVRYLQLAETSTIFFLAPLFIAALAGPFLGERLDRARLAAIVIGFCGVVVATRPGTAAFQPMVFLSIAGVACNAGYSLTTRALAAHDDSRTTLAWTQAAGVVLTTPFLPWVWVAPPSAAVWMAMAATGVFAVLGHAMLIHAHRLAHASFLAPFAYMQLLSMIAAGFLVFGDRPPAATLLGAAIVVGCGIFLALRARRGR